MQHLLRTADLTPEGVRHLVDLAAGLRRDPHRGAGELEGRSVLLHRAEPSTRLRLTFSAAAERLGATVVRAGAGEAVPAGHAAVAVVAAHGDHDAIRQLAGGAGGPVVNARSDLHHPCQGLADLLTLHGALRDRDVRRVAYVGEAVATAHSLMEACALAGVDLVVATPRGSEPDPGVVEDVVRIGRRTGSVLRLTHDPVAGVVGADAVHAGPWFRLGLDDAERAVRQAALRPGRAAVDLVELAAPHAVLLRAGPVHPGDEVPAGAARSRRSLAREQAANLEVVAAAVLLALHRGDLPPAPPAPSSPPATRLSLVTV